jgi:hypothetical protein
MGKPNRIKIVAWWERSSHWKHCNLLVCEDASGILSIIGKWEGDLGLNLVVVIIKLEL